jgi:hypothetical protein
MNVHLKTYFFCLSMLLPCISFGRNFSLGTVDNFLLVTNNRLKQTDFDGNYNCFKPLALEPCVESHTRASIYPTPANNILNLSFNFPEEKIKSISIHNLFGKIVFYSQTYSSPVLLFGNIDGIYILQINLETKTIMENFVISNQ